MRYSTLVSWFALVTWLVLPVRAFAVLAVPSGLQPGDTYQWVFVTSGELDAFSSDINDYDTFVQDQANLNPDLAGITFKAIGSTETVNARDNAVVGAPVYRLDGVNVATGFADMWDGSLNAAISVNQFNQAIVLANSPVHTGSNDDGLKFDQKWLGSSLVIGGDALSTTGNWIFLGQQTSDHLKQYYGLSEVLTVSAVPEIRAVTAWLMLSAICGAMYASRRYYSQFNWISL